MGPRLGGSANWMLTRSIASHLRSGKFCCVDQRPGDVCFVSNQTMKHFTRQLSILRSCSCCSLGETRRVLSSPSTTPKSHTGKNKHRKRYFWGSVTYRHETHSPHRSPPGYRYNPRPSPCLIDPKIPIRAGCNSQSASSIIKDR
jgi:hypothetical protein